MRRIIEREDDVTRVLLPFGLLFEFCEEIDRFGFREQCLLFPGGIFSWGWEP